MKSIKNIAIKAVFSFFTLCLKHRKDEGLSKVLICLPSGKYISSNTRALLTFLNDWNPDFAIIGYKSKNSLQSDIHKMFPKIESVELMSLKGSKYWAKTKCILISNGSHDHFPHNKLDNQVIVNMWHSLPLKDISTTSKKDVWDYVIASSAIEKEVFIKAFKLEPDQVKILGIPKTDQLFQSKKDISANSILYVPTFREIEGTKLLPFTDVDLKLLDEFLGANGLTIDIKFHINEKNKVLPSEITNCSNIRLLPVDIDLEKAIRNSLAMITDYSGVFYDALALDIPIIFIPYDIKEYSQKRGFILNYDEFSPGIKIKKQKELVDELKLIVNNKDSYKDVRNTMRDMFFQHKDGKSIERLIKFLTKCNSN